MKVLGVIPARANSKRVKNKNIKFLGGKPLIAHTIAAAKTSKLLTETIVSTDSEEIKSISEDLGGKVPFLRPEKFAQDHSGDKEVLIHALDEMKRITNISFDAVMLLRPTTPFKTGEIIDQVITRLINENLDSVRTVTSTGGTFHPYWMYTMDVNGIASPFDPENTTDKYYQSNLLPPVYRLNGVADIISTNTLKNHQKLYGDKMGLVEVDEFHSQDIDTEFEFKVAQLMFEYYFND